jgi:hypothetical protein
MERLLTLAFLSACLLAPAASMAAPLPASAASDPEIRPGPGVIAISKLSAYLPSLTNTPGDTFLYLLKGSEPGGTVLVAGGTHANEIAGVVAATLLIEHAKVQKGRLIVIAHANYSAATYPDPTRDVPSSYTIKTSSEERHFRYGARLTKPEHQGVKDPAKFRNPTSTESLPGFEARNLDRAYPGRSDGNLTERIAWAILQVLKRESVNVAFDFHESPPDSRLAKMIVAHPKSIDIAALAILDLDAAGVGMRLERSSETFRGLSHREWGDATKAHAFLFETPHPGMVKNAAGVDVVNDPQYPLSQRVGMQLSSFLAVLEVYNGAAAPALSVKVQDVPSVPQVVKSGVGSFLK